LASAKRLIVVRCDLLKPGPAKGSKAINHLLQQSSGRCAKVSATVATSERIGARNFDLDPIPTEPLNFTATEPYNPFKNFPRNEAAEFGKALEEAQAWYTAQFLATIRYW
jgi:hypothetical protein